MTYYTINTNYNLRKKAHDFCLYNKSNLINYTLSYKLYFLLSLFYKKSCSLETLKEGFIERGIDLTDFEEILKRKEFSDLLVPCEPFIQKAVYHEAEELPKYTDKAPERVDFFITKHCNLACKHCFEGSSPLFPTRRMSLFEIQKLASQLEAANIKTLKITGGEPYSHPDIDLLLSELSRQHFEIMILTNALLLSAERIMFIKKNHIQLGISLDGVTEDTHDFIRGKGCFKKLVEVLNMLHAQQINFDITCTVNKRNFRQLDEIVEYVLRRIDARTLLFNRLRPLGRSNEHSDMVLSEQEYRDFYKIYLHYKELYGERILLSDDSVLTEIPSLDRDVHCLAGNSLLAIDENFDVYPCIYGIGFSEYRMGNLLKQDLDEIWSVSDWNIFRGSLKVEDLTDCSKCKMMEYCTIKNCRLKPVYEGRSFRSSVSYCGRV